MLWAFYHPPPPPPPPNAFTFNAQLTQQMTSSYLLEDLYIRNHYEQVTCPLNCERVSRLDDDSPCFSMMSLAALHPMCLHLFSLLAISLGPSILGNISPDILVAVWLLFAHRFRWCNNFACTSDIESKVRPS